MEHKQKEKVRPENGHYFPQCVSWQPVVSRSSLALADPFVSPSSEKAKLLWRRGVPAFISDAICGCRQEVGSRLRPSAC